MASAFSGNFHQRRCRFPLQPHGHRYCFGRHPSCNHGPAQSATVVPFKSASTSAIAAFPPAALPPLLIWAPPWLQPRTQSTLCERRSFLVACARQSARIFRWAAKSASFSMYKTWLQLQRLLLPHPRLPSRFPSLLLLRAKPPLGPLRYVRSQTP